MTPELKAKLDVISMNAVNAAEMNDSNNTRWLLYFRNMVVLPEIFTSEAAARTRLEGLINNWDCSLFVSDDEFTAIKSDLARHVQIAADLATELAAAEKNFVELGRRAEQVWKEDKERIANLEATIRMYAQSSAFYTHAGK